MAAAAATVPQAASGHVRDEGAAERRHPLRFVWQMDADGRFVVGSDEFIELMGPRTTAAFGRLWSEIAAELKLDPENQIARAVATRETWSGVTVSWPVDDGERAPAGRVVGTSGVRPRPRVSRLSRVRRLSRSRPHQSSGARASRAPDRLHDAARGASGERRRVGGNAAAGGARRDGAATAPAPAAPETKAEDGASGADRPALNVVPAAANVVPFRAGAAPEPKAPTLSPVERKAFRELAQELTARLHGVREDLAEANRAGVLPAGGEAHAAEPAEALTNLKPRRRQPASMPDRTATRPKRGRGNPCRRSSRRCSIGFRLEY